ncbi:uncharacterized protein YbjT (DUF2867 family) [Rathayibacter sp. PhB127]|uniref:NmrA family NAD(P)-binding protein n=1 Tax=Rathayibacter sp. PhB127 TaxID=2485176 RepID=UPI000F4B625D|nr:NmrA family NAD(P)-binding protein [Rathayibacter sp. PhB127]ROS30023.1 uncharacterized protein YbjT (DUF2867 family) [Rathayibacter sp. PhB127]
MTTSTVLVTGVTGKTGRRLVPLLRAAGHTVREGSRRAATPFDWDDTATWPAALADIDAVYVVLPDLGSASTVDQVRSFARAASAAGVRTAVMVSFPETGGMDTDVVATTEQQFTDAGLALTVLRLRWFNQNFSEDFLTDSVRQGVLRLPAGSGREAFVDADDIAEVALAALTETTRIGRSYDLTGPRSLSFHDIADELSRATGRSIRYEPISTDTYIEEQQATGVPEEFAQMLAALYNQIGTGALDHTSEDIDSVLGRPARDFRDYADATATTGVWTE